MPIYADKKNGKLTGSFVIEVTEDGKRMKARARSMDEARQIEKDMKRGRWEPKVQQAEPTFLTLSALIMRAKLDRPKAKNSWRVQGELEYVETLLGADTNVEDITSKGLTDLAKRIVKERECSNATANRYVFALMGLLRWGREQDLVVRAAVFNRLDEGNTKRTRWLTQEQEDQIVEWLFDCGRVHEAMCVRVLGLTGMRSGELCSLTADQIDPDAGMVTLLYQKDGTGEEGIPLEGSLAFSLRQTIERGFMPSKAVLLKWFKKAAGACGIPVGRGKDGVVVHSIRHSTATRLIQAGVNPAEVQSYMRHKSWATTQRYVKITGQQKRKALEVLQKAGHSGRGNSHTQGATNSNEVKNSEQYQVHGAQGRNRTTDTAIFSRHPTEPTED